MSRKLTYDTWLFGAAMLIVVIGLVMIYSASAMIAPQRFGVDAYYFLTKQCVFLLVGGAVMLVLMHMDSSLFADRRLLYAAMVIVALALVVALFQPPINGTRRWLVLSHFQLQASEFAKPLIVLFLASFLSRREERIDDLATTLLLVALGMIFAAGLSWKRLALLSIGIVPVGIALAVGAAYRRDRLLVFLNPEADPQGKGFQAMQSLIALGTGGFRGLGLGNGRQKLFFLPEPHTDFIFSIIGEELGFAGAISLILLFGFLVWRGFRVAMRSQERFPFYAALGLTLIIAIQMLINVSVSLCLLPTKGLPLPLVSYGGSSLIASLMTVGILLNLSQQSS